IGETDKRYVIGERMLQRKDPFSANPEASHANFDSILAEIIATKINDGLGSTFILKQSLSYLLDPDSIFKAIDALNVNISEFVIVNFGLSIDYYRGFKKVKGLTEESYRGIPIMNFKGGRSINRSLFILRKEDLPQLSTLPIEQEVINKYALQPI